MNRPDYTITVAASIPLGDLVKTLSALGIELRARQDGTYYAQPTENRARIFTNRQEGVIQCQMKRL